MEDNNQYLYKCKNKLNEFIFQILIKWQSNKLVKFITVWSQSGTIEDPLLRSNSYHRIKYDTQSDCEKAMQIK